MADEGDTAANVPVLQDLTYKEIHAFQHGLYAGFVEGARSTDYRSGGEHHYWRMGYLLGTAGRYGLLVLAGVGLAWILPKRA